MNEGDLVRALREAFATHDPRVRVGVGDDAAVLAPEDAPLVVTVDAHVEGVHFERAYADLATVGRRATMAAASDLAAMGARPLALVAALGLPRGESPESALALARGQRAAADALGVAVVGGNLTRTPVLEVTTTALGHAERPVTRSGARPGDLVLLAGQVGLAAAGLEALAAGRRADPALAPAVRAFLEPVARIREGLAMAASATAAVDVSDGVGLDLGRLAEASGVALELDAEAVAAHGGAALADAARALGRSAVAQALGGGDDYALVATSPVPIAGFSCVGTVRAGEGVWVVEGSSRRRVAPTGYDAYH